MRDKLLQARDLDQACLAWHWSIEKGGDGRYNLACLYSQNGKVDEGFYYLIEAAAKEGVDPQHAQSDPDLTLLQKDARWQKAGPYLRQMATYWANQPIFRTRLILPRRGNPKLLVIGLHGMGGNENFVNEGYQEVADRLQAAFLGVSGTVPLGPSAFRWSEDWSKDQAHLEKAIASYQEKIGPCSKARVTFGFSQGAQTAFEVAGRDTLQYRGALVFSPGTFSQPAPSKVGPRQRFVIRVGAKENPLTLQCAELDAVCARRSGSNVDYLAYPNVSSHSFPPDFADKFAGWLRWSAQER